MSIKRYVASKTNTITNAYMPGLSLRGTGSTAGDSDVMEVFHIFAQANTASHEYSRALVQFPVDNIGSDRTAGLIPVSGSVSFYLRVFNCQHAFTIPTKFVLSVLPVSRSWDANFGLDIDEYSDEGYANWIYAASSSSGLTAWTSQGGDYHTASYVPSSTLPTYSTYFEDGTEDVNLDITSLVEEWLRGTKVNYGVGLKLDSGNEAALSSSYTKKFFARGTEYFFKRPVIEARWNSSIEDDRGFFYASSSLASTSDNTNTFYLYNYIRGQLRNIPGLTGSGNQIYVKLYDDAISGSCLTTTAITGGWISQGIYSASVVLNTTASQIFDRWYNSGLTVCYHTGAIDVRYDNASDYNPRLKYFVSIFNMKDVYSPEEIPQFRLFIRKKYWQPNIYSTVTDPLDYGETLKNIYYKVVRCIDNLTTIEYGTGSVVNDYSKLSYDASGSYFELDMSLLEPNYMYQLKFARKVNSDPDKYNEFNEAFKFRVEY
jgi:hypothetical protein